MSESRKGVRHRERQKREDEGRDRANEPIGYITVPVYEIAPKGYTSLRQGMLTAGPHAVSTGGGLGSDAVYLELGDEARRYCFVHGRDLLAAVLAQQDYDDWSSIPVTEGFRG